MAALEQEFDAPLLVRHGRGVAPTEAANKLNEGFKGLERQLRALKSKVGAASVFERRSWVRHPALSTLPPCSAVDRT